MYVYIKEQQHPNKKARRFVSHCCNKKGSKIKYILLCGIFSFVLTSLTVYEKS